MTALGLTTIMARPDQHPVSEAAERTTTGTARLRGMCPPGREGFDLATSQRAASPEMIGRIAIFGDRRRAQGPGSIREKEAACT